MKTAFGELTLANKLTIFRLFSTPVMIALLWAYAKSGKTGDYNDMLRISAAGLFLCLFFLDLLDGFIARFLHQTTRLGALLDPLADKALFISSLIALGIMPEGSFHSHMPGWFIIVSVSRDVYLSVGLLIIHTFRGVLNVKPRVTGKFATFFNAAVIMSMLLNAPHPVFLTCVTGAMFFTLSSAIQYSFHGWKQLNTKANGDL